MMENVLRTLGRIAPLAAFFFPCLAMAETPLEIRFNSPGGGNWERQAQPVGNGTFRMPTEAGKVYKLVLQ